MTKFLLIASVAAMAVTAPAQAERGGRKGEQQQAQQESDEARAEKRAKRQQQASPARAERQQQASQARAERPQAQERRQMRQEDGSNRRAAQQQVQSERRARTEQTQSDRRARTEQARSERRAQGSDEFSNRRAAQQQVQSDRRARMEQAQSDRPNRRARSEQVQSDRRARTEQAQSDRRGQRSEEFSNRRAAQQQIQSDRRARTEQARSDRRAEGQQLDSDRRSRFDQARSDRRSRFQQMESDQRSAFQQGDSDRRSRREQLVAERRAFTGDDGQWRQRLWERRAERQNAISELRDRRLARWTQDNDDRRDRYDYFRVGERVDRNWWYDDYVPYRYRSNFYDNDRYYYRYDGDYLYRLNRNDNVVMSLFPILGGAYSVGRPMPYYYDSYYNVPRGYSSLYYDTPNSYYRYGDGAVYGIDPTTQLITGIVALLTGQNFGVGQMLPMGYDAYNVPNAYRSTYYDTPDQWYRYDDGYIYGVDPRTRLIQTSYPVYGGYMVGNQWPAYAGYGYDVPDYYDDLYYDAPGYDYRYASGGIYQVDPKTQLIAAVAALVTGQNFNVGQRLPLGYDAYNVPFAYRDQYYDNDDHWYRYADGRILQVDPRSRTIRRVILV